MTKKNPHVGSSFDDFLIEEGLLAEANATALKRVFAWKLQQEMSKRHISKTAMAQRIGTSRAGIDRLLDSDNLSVTLKTIASAAAAIGQRLQWNFDAPRKRIAKPRKHTSVKRSSA